MTARKGGGRDPLALQPLTNLAEDMQRRIVYPIVIDAADGVAMNSAESSDVVGHAVIVQLVLLENLGQPDFYFHKVSSERQPLRIRGGANFEALRPPAPP